MNKISFKPNQYLSKYIDRFYIYKKYSCVKFNLPIVLPGTGLELLFHLNNTISINNNNLTESHIICPRKNFKFDETNHVNFISVRFKSGSFRHFTPIPHTELNDTYLSITDIWGNRGKELTNKINETDNLNQKIELIEDFLTFRLLENTHNENKKWDPIISMLYTNFNTINLTELANHSHLSYRQFERNFKRQFGVTAKKFQRITRFQDTVKKTLLNNKKLHLNTILDNGFFDQSHFINEFKKFTGLKPSNYFIQDNFKNNFYNKSIKQQ